MCKTIDLHRNYYTTAKSNLLKISISGMPMVDISLTLSFLHQPNMLVVASLRLHPVFHVQFNFYF